MREEGALRLAGRARGVDEQQPVVVIGRRKQDFVILKHKLLEPGGARVECRGGLGVLVGAQEDGRLRVCQLIRELGRGEARVQRHQDQARLRAGEEDDDVLGARAGQRRDAVAADEPGLQETCREPVGALVELPVGRLLVAEVDRNAARASPAPDR